MEFIASIPLIGGFLAVILPFILMLGIVVFVHEFGHYIVARWCGIHAEVFSIGFGPVLVRWHDRRGTRWQIAAMPLGGYVKFLGDGDAASNSDPDTVEALSPADRARSFPGAALWRRALSVVAGPVANFLLAIVAFGGLAMWQGLPSNSTIIAEVSAIPNVDMGVRAGDEIVTVNGQTVATMSQMRQIIGQMPEPEPLNVEVRRDGTVIAVTMPFPITTHVMGTTIFSPARDAGLKTGDYIARANGVTMRGFGDLVVAVKAAEGGPVALEVIRDGAMFETVLVPVETESLSAEGVVSKDFRIGVSGGFALHEMTTRPTPWKALAVGAEQTWMVIDLSMTGLVRIVSGALSFKNIQGPIGIAQVSGESAKDGLVEFILVLASISTAIGMLNLFPIPVLDGGHLVLFAYEGVVGRQPPERVMRFVVSFGLAMVLLLMVFATYNDVTRIVMRWLEVS